MEEVPRRTSLAPLASPCFVLCLLRVETEGLLDYQGRAGIISIVRWNLRPVIFGCDWIPDLTIRTKKESWKARLSCKARLENAKIET